VIAGANHKPLGGRGFKVKAMDQIGNQREINKVGETLLRQSPCVAITGAGLSTQSDQPDFRSPGKGLWEQIENMPDSIFAVMSLQGFKVNPEAFYNRFRLFLEMILFAKPNPAHIALAELETSGYIQAIITMNGDMLHQKAGSKRVIEIHGTIARAICISCYQSDEGVPHWQQYIKTGKIPQCRHCGGIMKPDVILTGEQFPVKMVMKAKKKLLQESNVILAVGTSFSGGSVMNWIEKACEQGKKIVIINFSPTILDSIADVVIRADVAEVLPAIAEMLVNA
jgi:NAD-dependent deacetylase